MKRIIIFIVISFSSLGISQKYLPLEVGNESFYTLDRIQIFDYGSWWTDHLFKTFKVTDSIYIDSIKYFKVNGFFDFNNGTIIRYDDIEKRIYIYRLGTDYLYMDFQLENGTVFSQIQPNNTFLEVTVTSGTTSIFDKVVPLKGFIRETVYPVRYKKGWYYFSPDIGIVSQNETSHWWFVILFNIQLQEYLIYDSHGNVYHEKHKHKPDIQFQPNTFLPDLPFIIRDFEVKHPLSGPIIINSRTYIDDASIEYYYSDYGHSLYTIKKSLSTTDGKQFSLNFEIDTSLYNMGYNLYYRIFVKDKGIIPDYYYKPDSGYYKLYWRDSVTSIDKDGNNIVTQFSLYQNYPNPFNPVTKIKYSIPSVVDEYIRPLQAVIIKIYDILGNEITTLVNESKPPGIYEVDFNAGNLPSGIYFYRLKAGSFIETKKMILLR